MGDKQMSLMGEEAKSFWSEVTANESIVVDGKEYSGRKILPNSVELDCLKKTSYERYARVPFAVRVKRYYARQIGSLTPEIIEKERKDFRARCLVHKNHKHLFHFQFPAGTELPEKALAVIEECQLIDETPFFLGYSKGPREAHDSYIKRQLDYKTRHKDKLVLPVLGLDTLDPSSMARKAQQLVKHGFKACVVTFGGVGNPNWNLAMSILKAAHVYVIVVGVTPRRTKGALKASLLAYPFLFGANCVCHGLPWFPGTGPILFLNRKWLYASDKHRETGDPDLDYSVSRVQAIETANISCEEDLAGKTVLELIQTVEGFNYFAKRKGMSNIWR